ncbi:MAG: bis(5'-nucleosyl)-tetraphosphatase (symmetrical) YqeK [Limnochordia bacterium]
MGALFSSGELPQEIFHRVQRSLSAPRFAHTLRVVEAATALARTWKIQGEKAALAALLHDYARDLPKNTLLKKGDEFGIINLEIEERFPLLLHGPVGARLAQRDFQITDPDILAAIHWHTTGRRQMSLLEKIIFLADYVEAGRDFPGVDKVRQLVHVDIDQGLLLALNQSIVYIIQRGWPLHPQTVEARNHILNP